MIGQPGAFLNEVEKARKASSNSDDNITDASAPLSLHAGRVMPDWIDYNGHMTEYRYGHVFSDATDAVLTAGGMDKNYLDKGYSFYTVETHIRHLGEMSLGDEYTTTSQILLWDGKKASPYPRDENKDGDIVATGEHMLLHVDQNKGASAMAQAPVSDGLAKLAKAHEGLAIPDYSGRSVGVKK